MEKEVKDNPVHYCVMCGCRSIPATKKVVEYVDISSDSRMVSSAWLCTFHFNVVMGKTI